MKKIIMIGVGSYCETLTYYINDLTDWEICGYSSEVIDFVTSFNNKPYVPISQITKHFPPANYEIVLAVGYSHMNDNRKRIYNLLKSFGYSFPNLIHPSSILNNVKIGDANIILENVVIEPNTIIGNDTIIWSSVLIGHNAIVMDHCHFAACSLIAGNTKVGNNCFLGNHSTLKDSVELSDYTLLGAGVFCSKKTNEYEVVVPARSCTLNHKSIDLI